MANKYIDTTCTNNGDGTGSGCAASAGAAGAWNSFTELDGSPTYGTAPAAGDKVYVRTADGGGDISETMSAALVLPANTSATPIYLEFDDGTVWTTGGGGLFSFTNTVSHDLTIREGWKLYSTDGVKRFRRYHNSTTAVPSNWTIVYHGAHIQDTIFESSYIGSSVGYIYVYATPTGNPNIVSVAVFDNCTFKIARPNANTFNSLTDGVKIRLLNCTWDMSLMVSNGVYQPIFQLPGQGGFRQDMWGGGVTGENANCILYDYDNANSEHAQFRFYNFDYGLCKVADAITWSFAGNGEVIMEGSSGTFNYLYHSTTGFVLAGWSGNGNHPTLSATLPDASSTPWSLKCWNDNNYCAERSPLVLFNIQKIYNAAAATKTVRVEILIHDGVTSPQKDEWYTKVWFTKDSDGSQGYVTSKATGALTSSTAGWSSTTFGSATYVKYKIEISTGVDIKQYTPILVMLESNRAAGTTSQFYFVDPDFQLD